MFDHSASFAHLKLTPELLSCSHRRLWALAKPCAMYINLHIDVVVPSLCLRHETKGRIKDIFSGLYTEEGLLNYMITNS